MYALNLSTDNRCLSASPVNLAPVGAVFVAALPEGDLYEYRYENGVYIHDPLPAAEPSDPYETIPAAELAELQAKAAAYDILTEGVTT